MSAEEGIAALHTTLQQFSNNIAAIKSNIFIAESIVKGYIYKSY